MVVFRSMLFVPANNPRRVEKAFGGDADAVIVDLEDAVAESEKVDARKSLASTLPKQRRLPAFVRVNAFGTEHVFEDIRSAVVAGVDGIILPKVEAREHVVIADWLLGQFEREQGIPHNSISILPHFESAAGIGCMCDALRVTKRTRVAGFGGGDFATDLRLAPSRSEVELSPYRASLVLASRQCGLEAPIDSVWSQLVDTEGLRATAEASRRGGFQGKRCIHPDQVRVVNEVFSPTSADISWAQRVVDAYQESIVKGLAAIRVGDEFVDLPVVEKANQILALQKKVLSKGSNKNL